VTDEHAVADPDAVAHEAVTLDLAVGAHDGAALDLDVRADRAAIADPAPVEVDEREDAHVLAEVDIRDEPVRGFVGWGAGHEPTLALAAIVERLGREKRTS
jgi:hypothetical protein